ncbi:MAG: indole-3-glycerol phosphate synthase TrpC [Armatimonadetes bacterium]|nr:indole-3-glycerol phosphate synthase TrpC [Armatimonadota bacterium]
MILDTILEEKRAEVERRSAAMPVRELKSRVSDAPTPIGFMRRLSRDASGLPAVIAEVKKASPSKGVIRPDFDPEAIARAYESAGASAISVLTDEKFFQGSLDFLRLVKRTVSLPVLRKDFIIDEYQVFESRTAGADAILLIVAALEKSVLAQLMNRATELGMDCLVEVHDEAEVDIALHVGAPLIGINNRNLQTFEVSLNTTERLLRSAECGVRSGKFGVRTDGAKFVSESGIFTREDIVHLGELGVEAVLIGEALMREQDIEAKLRELIG